jgi:hypothetical protein
VVFLAAPPRGGVDVVLLFCARSCISAQVSETEISARRQAQLELPGTEREFPPPSQLDQLALRSSLQLRAKKTSGDQIAGHELTPASAYAQHRIDDYLICQPLAHVDSPF